ncbi:DUF6584 family protein [Peribacillus frigoritolerans]|uniref:DUF6584 family protein n=1 Tax=Peribacillus frigoritolerans TaxID=450367 RepID=UPI0039C97769
MEKVPVKTIKKIEEDIEKNDLGKARDRLIGLISTYPNELELRKKIRGHLICIKIILQWQVVTGI